LVYPDCIGLNVDDARQKLYEINKDSQIIVTETHSFKDKIIKPLSEATVIRQKNSGLSVELIVAFF